MTIDLGATYGTIDALQHAGDYEELELIAQYAIDAIMNDNHRPKIRLRKRPFLGGKYGKMRKVWAGVARG